MTSNSTSPSVGASSQNIEQASVNSARPPATMETQRIPVDATKRKSQKDMTKAERRELQERQREEKKKLREAGLTKAARSGPTSQQQQPSSQYVQKTTTTVTPASQLLEEKQKKKNPKVQQNEVSWLVHLESPKRPDTTGINKDLHPAVLSLGLYFSDFKIVGSNARCVAMLETFSKVIEDHKPPQSASLSRHIQKHLDPHIAYLLGTRPMSLSMRECIRWLKKEISGIVEEDPPLSDDDTRSRLKKKIEDFITRRITKADEVIIDNGLQKIQDGDVILTFGKSSIVEKLLLEAKKQKKISFKVIVVDSRPLFEGKHIVRRLVAAGIECSYQLLSSVYVALKSVTKVIMGAHALLNNGAVYSRIGTAMVAMAANDRQIPVLICCETYKFVNRTQVDSFVLNEIGNPDDLVATKLTLNANHQHQPSPSAPPLASWRDQPNLRLLNLLYDVTPSKYITLVVTEAGLIPSTSAPVIWREYNEEFEKRG